MKDFPESQMIWSATDKAWRCVATRDRRENEPSDHVAPGDLLNGAAEFAQWQLAAQIRQGTLPGEKPTQPEAYIYLRQAMLNEGYGNAGIAITHYEKAIAAGLASPAIFYALGLLYRLVDRRQEARAAHMLASRHPFYRRAVALLE